MVPVFIWRVLKATGICAVLIAPYLWVYHQSAALAFLISSAWMMANLVVWTAVIVTGIRPDREGKALPLLGFLSLKLMLLVGGVITLAQTAPHSRTRILAITGGITLTLLVLFLKALGGLIMAARKKAIERSKASTLVQTQDA
jgi:hypothetical protein